MRYGAAKGGAVFYVLIIAAVEDDQARSDGASA
jgi:hypothetical protein